MDVLLVDDHPEVRLSLADFLEQLGHNAVHAGTGEEALRLIRDRHPGLVITDLRMPGADGMELVRHIRDHHRGTGVIMVTGFATVGGAVSGTAKNRNYIFPTSHIKCTPCWIK